MLIKLAQTSLNSKLIANYKTFFSEMIVTAVEKLDDYLDKDLIGIKHVTGGSITDSILVEGVAFKKTFLMLVLNNNQNHLRTQKY